MIAIDLPARTLHVVLAPNELTWRRAGWGPPAPKFTRGWLARYAALVTNASLGAVLEVPGPAPTPGYSTATPVEAAR